MTLRVAMLGDVVGLAGVRAVQQLVPMIRPQLRLDLVIVNGENAAGGSGLTPELYNSLCSAGVDGITLGDHAYKKNQITKVLSTQGNLIRPANLSPQAVGRKWMCLRPSDSTKPPVYVFTVLGRIFAPLPVNSPFEVADEVLSELPAERRVVIAEVHAEATSEKQALAWHLDGRVAAVLGTHTHVATADARILPQGAAFMCDLGMCGSQESIIGRKIQPVLYHMTTSMPAPFDVADGDPRISGAVLDIDEFTCRATAIQRLEMPADVTKPPFA